MEQDGEARTLVGGMRILRLLLISRWRCFSPEAFLAFPSSLLAVSCRLPGARLNRTMHLLAWANFGLAAV